MSFDTRMLNIIEQVTDPDIRATPESLFWDWFCKDSALPGKGRKLLKKAQQLVAANVTGRKFNSLTSYVWFKNNCPMVGRLYDDLRISDLATKDVLYTIVPASGFAKNLGQGEIWGRENDFQGPLFTGNWREIVKWFATPQGA